MKLLVQILFAALLFVSSISAQSDTIIVSNVTPPKDVAFYSQILSMRTEPEIAIDESGNKLLVSVANTLAEYYLAFQLVDKAGNTIYTLKHLYSHVTNPAIVVKSYQDKFLVVWEGNSGIYAQIISSAGAELSEVELISGDATVWSWFDVIMNDNGIMIAYVQQGTGKLAFLDYDLNIVPASLQPFRLPDGASNSEHGIFAREDGTMDIVFSKNSRMFYNSYSGSGSFDGEVEFFPDASSFSVHFYSFSRDSEANGVLFYPEVSGDETNYRINKFSSDLSERLLSINLLSGASDSYDVVSPVLNTVPDGHILSYLEVVDQNVFLNIISYDNNFDVISSVKEELFESLGSFMLQLSAVYEDEQMHYHIQNGMTTEYIVTDNDLQLVSSEESGFVLMNAYEPFLSGFDIASDEYSLVTYRNFVPGHDSYNQYFMVTVTPDFEQLFEPVNISPEGEAALRTSCTANFVGKNRILVTLVEEAEDGKQELKCSLYDRNGNLIKESLYFASFDAGGFDYKTDILNESTIAVSWSKFDDDNYTRKYYRTVNCDSYVAGNATAVFEFPGEFNSLPDLFPVMKDGSGALVYYYDKQHNWRKLMHYDLDADGEIVAGEPVQLYRWPDGYGRDLLGVFIAQNNKIGVYMRDGKSLEMNWFKLNGAAEYQFLKLGDLESENFENYFFSFDSFEDFTLFNVNQREQVIRNTEAFILQEGNPAVVGKPDFGYQDLDVDGSISKFMNGFIYSVVEYSDEDFFGTTRLTLRKDEYSLTPVGVEGEAPVNFFLLTNYPNPFNPETTVQFNLPESGNVRLNVYNTLGELVTTLANGEMTAGQHNLTFNAQGMASGVYIARLDYDNGTKMQNKTIKMLVLK